jgi:hypothetical protein
MIQNNLQNSLYTSAVLYPSAVRSSIDQLHFFVNPILMYYYIYIDFKRKKIKIILHIFLNLNIYKIQY